MKKGDLRHTQRQTKVIRQAVRRTGGQADRRSGGQADRRTGGQADIKTDILKEHQVIDTKTSKEDRQRDRQEERK